MNERQIMEILGFKLFKDGDQWCAVEKNRFRNLQVSPAGFGDTQIQAMKALVDNLGYKFQESSRYTIGCLIALVKTKAMKVE